jgi:hypothetical protein
MFYSIKIKNENTKLRVLLVTGLLFLFSFLNLNAQENSVEPFNLSVKFENIGWQDFFVLYNEPNDLYLPVSQLFDFVKINSKLSNNGKLLEGYFIDPNNPYKIDFDARSVSYKFITTSLADDDVIYDLGTMYLSPRVLESVFGFNTKFDFRTLSANISTSYELPISKLKKLEDARRNIKNITGDEKFDATYPRKYHLFKPGMLDWSISSNQSQVYGNENRAGLALGTEMFGGELSAWLYYSDKYGFNRNQQRYHWRWVDNNFKVMKQVQFGRIYNRNIATMLYPVDGFMITNAPTTASSLV